MSVIRTVKDLARRTGVADRLAGVRGYDRAISSGYRALNLAQIGAMGLRRGPLRAMTELWRYRWQASMLRVDGLHHAMTQSRSGRYREANACVISSILAGLIEMLDGLADHPDRVVLHEDLVPPEILVGMGLEPWMAELLGIVLPMLDASAAEPYIDVAESAGVPPDVCSLPKSTVGMALSGQLPRPVAIVSSNMPCDGGLSQYTIIERELGAPAYRVDVPHDFYDPRAVEYFAGELRRLISWLEEHTPGRMDWDRMREVCAERNRMVEAELELWDLIRHRPAPMAAEPVYLTHMLWNTARPGSPRGTAVFQRVAELARRNWQQGIAAVADERYRVALWNPPTLMALDLFAWAEQAYGVALIMDMLTYHRHPFIDTTSPETMLRDLGQIIMQGPMARHTRGPAENFFGDLFHLYEFFDLDMIWMAGHVGCKNSQALSGMFREKCRERGIPLLFIDYDLSDSRIVSGEGIRRQVEQFMDTVMQAERLDR